MKKYFLMGMIGLAAVWFLGFFLYRIALSFVDLYDDWQLSKEVKEIEREAAQRRQQQRDSEPPNSQSKAS